MSDAPIAIGGAGAAQQRDEEASGFVATMTAIGAKLRRATDRRATEAARPS
jgi:hypothetical protein